MDEDLVSYISPEPNTHTHTHTHTHLSMVRIPKSILKRSEQVDNEIVWSERPRRRVVLSSSDCSSSERDIITKLCSQAEE